MKIIKIGIAILIIVVMLSTASAANKYYLNPADSSVLAKDDTIDVELWLEAGEPVCGGAVNISYTYCCANITSYTPNKVKFEDMSYSLFDGQMNMMFYHFEGLGATNHPAGSYKLGTLTIQCCNDASNCNTDLKLIESLLYESVNYAPTELDFTTENGTFTCGTPACEPCLGDCYESNDCTGRPFLIDVPCYDCLSNNPTNSWKPTTDCPNRVLVCPTGECYTGLCPQCCDGNDNDGDGVADCPDDPGCACCCDSTEEDDPDDPEPCVPELPTIALMSIGVLGMLLLVRKRG